MIDFSKEWYEQKYHSWLHNANWKEALTKWGHYKSRYIKAFEKLREVRNNYHTVLLSGSHHGKDCIWFEEVFPKCEIHSFDFCSVSIDWCRENYPNEATFHLLDASDLKFYNKFDLVVSIDFTEHLPIDVYSKYLDGVQRSIKQGGDFYVYHALTPMPEHINKTSRKKLIDDICNTGLSFVDDLFDNHYLFRK